MPSFTFAQDAEPVKIQGDLKTTCHQDKNSKVKLCKTMQNGKTLREIFYSDGKLLVSSVYYMSGRKAKLIIFYQGQLQGVLIYPNQNLSDDFLPYSFTFENGKLKQVNNSRISLYKTCITDSSNATKCDELNYFYPSSEPNLHPALALPKENQGLDVLTSNGIKMP